MILDGPFTTNVSRDVTCGLGMRGPDSEWALVDMSINGPVWLHLNLGRKTAAHRALRELTTDVLLNRPFIQRPPHPYPANDDREARADTATTGVSRTVFGSIKLVPHCCDAQYKPFERR